MDSKLRKRAEAMLGVIARNLPRWTTWYPNDESEVEIARADLLALAECSKMYLAEHPEDEDEPLANDVWLRSVMAEVDTKWQGWGHENYQCFEVPGKPYFGIQKIDEFWYFYHLTADGFDGSETCLGLVQTRGDLRATLRCFGIDLKE